MKKSMCSYPAPEDPAGNAEFRRVPLTQGKFAIVDAEDFDWIMRWKWFAHLRKGHWYAARTGLPRAGRVGRETISMHRVLCFAQPGEVVDHINGDTLDNRQRNIRRCSQQENTRGFRRRSRGKTSKFRGVCWYPNRNRWLARIQLRPGVRLCLGYFLTEDAASRAYAHAVRLHFGAFANANIFSQESHA